MTRHRRIGEGHRRKPGDLVMGSHPAIGDIIGRVMDAYTNGDIAVEADDGRWFLFNAKQAARLTTLQECNVPTRRTSIGVIIDLTAEVS